VARGFFTPAAAVGVTDRLCDVIDIVSVVEEYETRQKVS
jgi:hypothetical protein